MPKKSQKDDQSTAFTKRSSCLIVVQVPHLRKPAQVLFFCIFSKLSQWLSETTITYLVLSHKVGVLLADRPVRVIERKFLDSLSSQFFRSSWLHYLEHQAGLFFFFSYSHSSVPGQGPHKNNKPQLHKQFFLVTLLLRHLAVSTAVESFPARRHGQ